MAAPLKRARFYTDAPSSEASPPISSVSCSPRKEWQTHMPSAICIDFVLFLDFRDRNAFGGVCRSYRAAVIQCGGQEILQAQRGLSRIAAALKANENPVLTEMADTIEKILSSKPPGKGLNNPRITHQRRMLAVMGRVHDIFTGRVIGSAPTAYTLPLHEGFKAELVGCINDWDVIRLCLKYFGGAVFRVASSELKLKPENVVEAAHYSSTALRHLDPAFRPSARQQHGMIAWAAIWNLHLMKDQLEFAAHQKRRYENPLHPSTETEYVTSIIADTQPAVDLPRPLAWKIWPQKELQRAEMSSTARIAMSIEELYPDWLQLTQGVPWIHLVKDTAFFTALAKHPYLRSSVLLQILPEQITEEFLIDVLEKPFELIVMFNLARKMHHPTTKKFIAAMTDKVQVKFMCLANYAIEKSQEGTFHSIIQTLYPDRSLPNYSLILEAFFSLVDKECNEEYPSAHDNVQCSDLLEVFLNKQLPGEPDGHFFDEILTDELDPYANDRDLVGLRDGNGGGWAEWPSNVASILKYALQCIPNTPENQTQMETILADTLNGKAFTLKNFLLQRRAQLRASRT